MDPSIYIEHGYADRAAYLAGLAEDYGMDLQTVIDVADMLGEDEDFDALVTTMEDYDGSN